MELMSIMCPFTGEQDEEEGGRGGGRADLPTSSFTLCVQLCTTDHREHVVVDVSEVVCVRQIPHFSHYLQICGKQMFMIPTHFVLLDNLHISTPLLA